MKDIYILLFFLCSMWGIAQKTPGGITGAQVEIWLKADELSPHELNDGDPVSLWQDNSGKNRNFIAPTAFLPRYVESSLNYNPSVDFYYEEGNAEEGIPVVSAANNNRRKLQTQTNFVTAQERAYSVIWVSRVDTERSNPYATVLKLGGSGTTNSFGWTDKGELWDQIGGTITKYIPVGNNYGIGMSIIPNVARNSNNELYFNGLKNSGRSSSTRLNTSANFVVIGNSGNEVSTTNSFHGEVQEVIVLSHPVGTTLTPLEMNQINTYLAIKYSISLENIGGQRSYVLSNRTRVFNAESNGYINYSKDVFGIARDDESGLNQKQSISSANPFMAVYLGELEEKNTDNKAVLTDKHALMFGGNGSSGIKTYTHEVGTKFANYTLSLKTDSRTGVITEERLTSIYNYKYKAKTTGKNAFTVNVAPQLGEWLLISKDENFSPANTRIYQIKGGKVEDVVINDGDYVGFAFYFKAPGGVTNGLKMWLNASIANTISVNRNGEVLNWSDYTGLGTNYRRRVANKSSALYVESDERTNFHPTLLFRKDNDYLVTDSAPFSQESPADVAIYTVINHSFATDRSYFLGFGNDVIGTNARRPSFGVFRDSKTGQGLGRIGSSGLTNSKKRLFTPKSTTIAGYHWKVGSQITFEFDAHSETVRHTYKSVVMNAKGMLGLGSSAKTYYLDGVMPEVIAYEGILTQNEKNRINSYLGLKYGITIDLNKESPAVNFDYSFSDGSSIWKGNDNIHNVYHNNVTSVLRDDNASLYNRQSKSTEFGSIVHMGVGTKLGKNPQLGDILEDRSSITWGHNNQPILEYSFAGNQEICGAMDSRLNGRFWLVDKVKFDQNIMISAYGPNFPYNGANYQVFMLVADSASKLATNKWDQIVPMAFVDDKHIANYQFTDKYTYFTFGAKVVGTCESCEFEGVKTIDFSKNNWNKKGDLGPKKFNLGDDFNVTVSIDDPSKSLSSGYPRTSSLKTLREKKRANGVVTTKISFTNNAGEKSAAATSFELYDIDRTGRVNDIVEVIGYCNGSPVYPKLSYTYNKPEKSRYTVDNAGKAEAKPRGILNSGNSGYTNRRGRVFVDFENPVEEVRIVYKTRSVPASNASSYIGIGPMEFYCVAPLPPPNESGLIFVKQGTVEAQLCEVVDYTFRAINTNCAPKEVLFTDTLQEGMVWLNDSFSAGGGDLDEANITGYGTRTLRVSGLMVPGGGSTYTFRASAVFVENATAGVYKNRAALEYDKLGTSVKLQSTDRLTGKDFTETIAIDSDRPKQVITSITTDSSCFSLSKEIEITLHINNPNDVALTDMFLGLQYESNSFTFVKGSLTTSSGLKLGSNKGEENGELEFEDFSLPKGESWVKYKVKASKNLADYEIDPVTKDPAEVTFSYDLVSESDDVCLASSLLNASGDIDLSFCAVCYYKPVAGDNGDIFESAGFMALTTLNRTNMDWMQERGNAFIVLESNTKGFVITRLTTAQILKLEAKEGMLVYDTTVNCVKMYNGTSWGCIKQGCVDE